MDIHQNNNERIIQLCKTILAMSANSNIQSSIALSSVTNLEAALSKMDTNMVPSGGRFMRNDQPPQIDGDFATPQPNLLPQYSGYPQSSTTGYATYPSNLWNLPFLGHTGNGNQFNV